MVYIVFYARRLGSLGKMLSMEPNAEFNRAETTLLEPD